MVDIHTHILPHMDDGASSEEMSLSMLQAEKQQGVSAVCLTPHFYRADETAAEFLLRREKSYTRLLSAVEHAKTPLPDLILGAEVAWVPSLWNVVGLESLCIGNTKNFLLELSFAGWEKNLPDLIYDLMRRTGLTPILAHLDRYAIPEHKCMIYELLDMGLPVQIGIEPFPRHASRKLAFALMERAACCTIATDCHNMTSRAPSFAESFDTISKKHTPELLEALQANSQLLAFHTYDAL